MGFLKRFFSLGSRKSKRKHEARTAQADPSGRIVHELGQQDQEGDVTRLLRSSSTHFSVVNEVDYSALPPLPHPINSVAHTPVATPTKSTSSMKRRGTYTVKVLERKLESRTEFPNANTPLRDAPPKSKSTPPEVVNRTAEEAPLPAAPFDPRSVPFTPRDQSRLIRLRQDPSVASLLYMYDDKGRLSSSAFSNTPIATAPVHGREPIKRSGSTLRQLLGEPDSVETGDVAEGDISWAERFLGEHANGSQYSLASTAPVETPKDTLFTHDPSEHTKSVMPAANITFSSDNSRELSADYPIISSMEVEVSGTVPDLNFEVDAVSVVDSATLKSAEPKTPMRASEVFGFLTERRKTVLERQKSLRALEVTPLGPVSLNPCTNQTARPLTLNVSPDTSDTSITTTSAQIHTATFTKLTPVFNPLSHSSDSINILNSPKALESVSYIPAPSTRVQLTGDSHSSASTTSSSKIPRGPRPQPSASRIAHDNLPKPFLASETRHDPLKEKATQDLSRNPNTPNTPGTRIPVPVDPFTPVRTRQQRRIVSHASSVASSDGEARRTTSHHKRSRKSERVIGKENSPPSVPARAIFDKRHPNMAKGDPPSPASSSELSPVGREMMTNLRKQRMKTRENMRSSLKRSPRRSP